MQVVALERGFFGSLYEPGDTFEVPDGSKASWFEKVEGGTSVPPEPTADIQEPMALSEMNGTPVVRIQDIEYAPKKRGRPRKPKEVISEEADENKEA